MREKIFTAHGGRFIKPDDCGSTVAWIVEVTARGPDPASEYDKKGWVRIHASASLSDCNRRIDWDFEYPEKDSLGKVDAAIEELQALRGALVKAFALKKAKKEEWKLEEEKEE